MEGRHCFKIWGKDIDTISFVLGVCFTFILQGLIRVFILQVA